MKRLIKKTILVLLLAIVFVGNVFTTNAQTFDITTEQCHLEDIHTNPCAIVPFGGNTIDMEQETDVSSSSVDVSMQDTPYISFIEKNITSSLESDHIHHPHDLAPHSQKQLARSHL